VKPWLVKCTVDEKAAENAMFWAGGYGVLTRQEVKAGQQFFLDNGLFFAASEKIDIGLGLPGGCISCCCGGEGIVMKFTGPCVVYSMNRSPHIWEKVLNPPQPKKKKKKGVSAVAAALG